MSTPRCLRVAIEACRPCKTTSSLLRPSLISTAQSQSYPRTQRTVTRDFSSTALRCADNPIDITAGFPMPEPGSYTIPELAAVPEEHKRPETQSRPPNRLRRTQSQSTRSETKLASSSPLIPTPEDLEESGRQPLVPPNVLAAYRTPLYHSVTHGIPVAQLQLRSFSTRNLEFFADFCVRAAYYLNLPCTGPVPLPQKIERWTVLKSNFVNKKAQENFERITLKRLITVYDGAPEVVELWLAFVRKWQYHGVGMKANVWQFEELDVADKMDRDFSSVEKDLDEKLRLFGFNKHVAEEKDLLSMMERQHHRREGVGMSEYHERPKRPRKPREEREGDSKREKKPDKDKDEDW